MKQSKFSVKISTIIITLLALLLAFTTLFPYLFTIVASLRKGADIYTGSVRLEDLTLGAYHRLFFGMTADEGVNLLNWLTNTLFYAVTVTVLMLAISALGGYALARMEFPLKNLWFSLILVVMMIPVQITMIPKYIMITRLMGWSNSYIGLIVPFLFSPYFTFMMRQFFLSFPKDLEEAAIIDGLGRFGVFIRVVIPLSKAPTLSAGILIFMGYWGSYLWPKLLISDAKKFVLNQGLASLMGSKYVNAPSFRMAAAVVATIPLIVLFAILQKQFMASITSSGIKG